MDRSITHIDQGLNILAYCWRRHELIHTGNSLTQTDRPYMFGRLSIGDAKQLDERRKTPLSVAEVYD
jgi:hypothetical protein